MSLSHVDPTTLSYWYYYYLPFDAFNRIINITNNLRSYTIWSVSSTGI